MMIDGALCAETDPEIFYPSGRIKDPWGPAARVCEACDVMELCVALNRIEEQHLDDRDIWGFVGGETPAERIAGRAA